jgi:lysozyme
MDPVKKLLLKHEGLRLRPYRCTAGKLTIGVGRNIEDVGISESEAMYMLDVDIRRCRRQLSEKLDWFETLDPVRRDALVDMCFNLGIHGLLAFKVMLSAMGRGDYAQAAIEALESKWAQQVGRRADRVSKMIMTGMYPPDLYE